MKKILFLLLLITSISQAQTTLANKLKITGNSISTTATKVNVQETDGSINWQFIKDFQNNKPYFSTGLLKNGLLTINADNTKFDLSAGIGVYSDFSDPENVTSKVFNFPAFNAVVSPYIATSNITYVAVNYNGGSPVLVMQAAPFSNTQMRDLVVVGAVIHSNFTTINTINNISSPSNDVGNSVADLFNFLGARNQEGNVYSANGANLQLNKSAGVILKYGANFHLNSKNPHNVSLPEQLSLTFRYRLQGGFEGTDRINVDVDNYDLNNVLTAVPPNKYTIQTIFIPQTGFTRIQYGQTTYNTLADAVAAINTRKFVTETNLASQFVKVAYLVVKKGATSLQVVADADIIQASKFDATASGGGAITYQSIIDALTFTPENVVNKQNSLAVDGTGVKYPTVDAVNAGLASKINGSGVSSRLAVFTNSNTLSSSRIFDSGVGFSFGGDTFFGGNEFNIPSFGNNTMYFGVTDGTENPRAYILHVTSSGNQDVHFGSAFSNGNRMANWIFESGNVVVNSGTISATNLSGTNTGDQTTISGNAGSATVLQTARTIGTTSGDVTSAGSPFNGSANNTNVLTLATVNSNVGTFGNASNSTTQTINAKGLTTAISNVPIQIAESQVTGLVSDLAGKYSTSNPAGYISSFTETDPTVPAYSKSLSAFSVIKTSTDALYEPIISPKNTAFNKPFGTTAGTVAEGNDSRFTDARNPLPNSVNYIQNQNASAQSANMRISGGVMATKGSFGSDFTSSNILQAFSPSATDADLFQAGMAGVSNGFTLKRVASAFQMQWDGAATFASTVSATSFNGSATLTGTPTAPTAAPGTNTTQIATTAFVQATRPYKVYTALLNQSGTSAPVATVLENTLGTITLNYTSAGSFTATSSALFTLNKTTVFTQELFGLDSKSFQQVTGTSNINLYTSSGGSYISGLYNNTLIEIRVYN